MSECFFVAYGGHWGKRGWTYYEVKFTTISAALQFYETAKSPKYIGRKSGKFKSELTKFGIEAEIEKEKGGHKMTIRKFDTREEAKAFIEKYDSGTYYLHHGEYERPNYRVRKIRNENAFGIYVTRYYYPTTLNAKKDGFLTWEETYEYE